MFNLIEFTLNHPLSESTTLWDPDDQGDRPVFQH